MAKYGLGQADLNLRVQVALSGGSDHPDRDIAKLLKSHQPIERLTREMLADAFEGKGSGLQLRMHAPSGSRFFRSFHSNLGRIKVGRLVRIEKLSSPEKAEVDKAWAKGVGASTKTLERICALSKSVDDWIDRNRQAHFDLADPDDFQLTVACAYALTKTGSKWTAHTRPEDWIKPSLQVLCKVMEKHHSMYEAQGQTDRIPILAHGIR